MPAEYELLTSGADKGTRERALRRWITASPEPPARRDMREEAELRFRVLVVEDDALQAEHLARLLSRQGYFVEVVSDGRDAVRRLRAGRFDAALIDHGIPEIDGSAVASVIRNLDSSSPRPRLIGLTASPGELPGGGAEFDQVLAKPVEEALLLQALGQSRAAGAMLTRNADPQSPAVFQKPGLGMPMTKGEGLGRARILLVDDDENLRGFLRLALQASDLDVDVAEDGLQAVQMIMTRPYDVAVIDFRMPGLDGLATAKIIYDQLGRHTRPRIVALTSTPESLVAQDGRWHLVLDAIVSKASGIPSVMAVIRNCLDYSSQRSEQPIEILDLQAVRDLQDMQRQLSVGEGVSSIAL